MNPDQDLRAQIAALQNTVDELVLAISQLGQANMIPRDIETAFTQRLGTDQALSSTGTTGAAGTPVVYAAFPVTVPANPSGTLPIVVKGITYNVLLK